MKVSDKTYKKLELIKEKEILIYGYKSTQIERDFKDLINGKEVEVGFRTSSGKKDPTLKVYEEWKKIIKQLKNDGFVVSEKSLIHPNKSPTLANGFWNSIVFNIENVKKKYSRYN